MKQTNIKHQKRPIKKRFILLNIAAAICILAALAYFDYAGDTYDLHTYYYCPDTVPQDITLVCEDDAVVEMTDWQIDENDELIVSLQSLEQGGTDAYVLIHNPDEAVKLGITDERYDMAHTHFTVTLLDTIVESRDGEINFSGFELSLYLFLGYLALAVGVLIYSFFDCKRKSEYSYRMIAYGGTALYLSVMLAILVYKLLNNVVPTFSSLLRLIEASAEWFLVLLFIPMALSAAAVSLSNIWLLRHEGFRPVNALGIAFSALWLLGSAGIVLARSLHVNFLLYTEDGTTLSEVFQVIRIILVYAITYFECMLIATSVSAVTASRHTPPLDRDYIIILGCAIRKDGSLTPLLQGRVDSALSFERRQYEATGKHARFVPSGGQGSDEIISESEAMERYLKSRGVEDDRILREDKSTSTYENMRFSKEVIEEAIGAEENTSGIGDKKIAFSTTNYHVFRGYILSQKNGFDAQGISAKTKWYFFPNAFLREFIGLLFDQKLRHAAIMLCIITAAIVMGLSN